MTKESSNCIFKMWSWRDQTAAPEFTLYPFSKMMLNYFTWWPIMLHSDATSTPACCLCVCSKVWQTFISSTCEQGLIYKHILPCDCIFVVSYFLVFFGCISYKFMQFFSMHMNYETVLLCNERFYSQKPHDTHPNDKGFPCQCQPDGISLNAELQSIAYQPEVAYGYDLLPNWHLFF